MKHLFKPILFILLLLGVASTKAQKVSPSEMFLPDSSKPVIVKSIFTDSVSCSSFAIEIKKEIKLHRHAMHSEQVYIVSGKALMFLADKEFVVSPGDLIFIPVGTPHKVKVIGETPLKVISFQSPYFDGKDRIMME